MSRRLTFVLLGLSGLVLLLVAAALAVPFLFRDRVDALIKARVHASVDADVEWQSVYLSVFRGFPHLRVTARGVRICNRAPFEGVCLAQTDEISARLSLLSLLGDTLDVRSVTIRGLRLELAVTPEGAANWDIARSDPAATRGAPALQVALRDYLIDNAHVVYADRASAIEWELAGLRHQGSGAFGRGGVSLDATLHADRASLRVRGVPWLHDAALDVTAAGALEVASRRLTIRESDIRLNDLALALDGTVTPAPEGLALDVRWMSKTDDLRGLVSLLPATLVGNLDGLETGGAVTVTGRAAGTYGERSVPALDLQVRVDDGRFKYAALPAGIDQLAITAAVASTEAPDWDQLTVDVPQFSARVAGHPLEGRVHLASMVSDPDVHLALRTRLDLAELPRVVAFTPGDTLAGHAEADLRIAGRVSSLREQQYHRFTAEGYADIRDVLYRRRASNRDLRIAGLSLTFNPRHVQLLAEGAGLGDMNVTVRGRLENYLRWWFDEDVLRGALEITGDAIDLAEVLQRDHEAGSASDQPPTALAGIPDALDVTLTAAARRVSYGSIELGGLRGQVRVHDRRADLSHVGFGLFGGSVVVNGSYDTSEPAHPAVSFSYTAKDIDIQQAARHSSALRAVAPVALAAAGSFGSTLDLTGTLTPSLGLDLASLAGRGSVTSSNVRLDRFMPLSALARALKIGELDGAAVGDVGFTFVLRDGRMTTAPFDVRLGELSLRVAGSTTFAGPTLDYDITGRMPTSIFGEEAAERVAEWLGPSAGGGVPALLGLTARLTGTVGQPSVAVEIDTVGAASTVRAAALEQARTEAERLMARARNEADAIRREADAAAARLQADADEAANRLVAEASNPLVAAGARLAASRLRQEAASRAALLVQAANGRADAVLEDARRLAAARVDAEAPGAPRPD